jgi:hypothetical protein
MNEPTGFPDPMDAFGPIDGQVGDGFQPYGFPVGGQEAQTTLLGESFTLSGGMEAPIESVPTIHRDLSDTFEGVVDEDPRRRLTHLETELGDLDRWNSQDLDFELQIEKDVMAARVPEGPFINDETPSGDERSFEASQAEVPNISDTSEEQVQRRAYKGHGWFKNSDPAFHPKPSSDFDPFPEMRHARAYIIPIRGGSGRGPSSRIRTRSGQSDGRRRRLAAYDKKNEKIDRIMEQWRQSIYGMKMGRGLCFPPVLCPRCGSFLNRENDWRHEKDSNCQFAGKHIEQILEILREDAWNSLTSQESGGG